MSGKEKIVGSGWRGGWSGRVGVSPVKSDDFVEYRVRRVWSRYLGVGVEGVYDERKEFVVID